MNVLICSTRMPEFDRESGSKRVFDLLSFLHDAGWAVTYVAETAEPNDRYVQLLRRSGVVVSVGLGSITDDFLTRGRFDLAILAFWHVAEQCIGRLRRVSPDTRVIVDSIDLHFLRNARGVFAHARQTATPGGLGRAFGDELARELNVYAAADAVLTVSEKESSLINDLTADAGLAHCVPDCENLPRSGVSVGDRTGVLFLGNFWHRPNVEAVEYLVKDIVPRLNPRLLERHPVWVVGHATDDRIRNLTADPHVRFVGWVPSLMPYLHGARVMVLPLLHGAGTKRKFIQTLMAGTPAVSTSVGAEGLPLVPDRDLVLADDADEFAEGIERLLTDDAMWTSMASHGFERVTAIHGRDAVRQLFLETVSRVMACPVRAETSVDALPADDDDYGRMATGVRAAVEEVVPAGARVAVISKGDERLLGFENRSGEHFPRLADGRYAGSYPADGRAAIEGLEQQRAEGVEYLVVPSTASWWLDHYREFNRYLTEQGHLRHHSDTCLIYGLGLTPSDRDVAPVEPARAGVAPETRATPVPALTLVRPATHSRPTVNPRTTPPRRGGRKPRVLVAGIYMAGKPNYAADEVSILRAATQHDIDQRWIALGGEAPTEMAEVTVRSLVQQTPKFQILNELLSDIDVSTYDYFMVLDDDVGLPVGFADTFLNLQRELGFALAQPARTSDSYLDHPIVEQQRGVLARETRFVEIGPVFSVARAAYDLLVPFDSSSPMGWGYENVWSHRLGEQRLKMGIIDAVPVSHSLRKPVANYSWHTADAERQAYLASHAHLDLDECFRVVDVVELKEARRA